MPEEYIPAGDPWRSVKDDIEFDPDGYLLFDDTVVSKPYAKAIQGVRRQWSGSEKRVIEGSGVNFVKKNSLFHPRFLATGDYIFCCAWTQ